MLGPADGAVTGPVVELGAIARNATIYYLRLYA